MTATNHPDTRSANDPKEPTPRNRDVQGGHAQIRDQNLDKTIEDSFPASDPPSTDPNPDGDE